MKKIIWFILAVLLFLLSCLLVIYYVIIVPLDHQVLYSVLVALLIGSAIHLFIVAYRYMSSVSRNKILTLKNRLSRWSKLSPRVNQIGDFAFNNLPVGILVLDENTDVVKWINQYATKILGSDVIDKSLSEINEQLTLVFEHSLTNHTIHINDDFYDVSYQQEGGVLYLFTVTVRETIKKEFQDITPAIGLCTLDSLEENLMDFDMSQQSAIKGQYLAALADWTDKFHGFFRILGENRFLILSNQQQLKLMCQEKFEILEIIREISVKNNIRVTLSLGFASWNRHQSELGSFAQSGLDLSLRRGGDQVVVNIENEQIMYFGAKSGTAHKESRVNARFNTSRIKDLVANSDQVFIQGHYDTDYDALGAMIGIWQLAVNECKDSYIIVDKEKLDANTKIVYELLESTNHPIIQSALTTKEALELYGEDTLNIIVDTQNYDLLHSPELIKNEEKTIIIDHHRPGDKVVVGELAYIDSAASSTVELVVELIAFSGHEYQSDTLLASIMYAGVLVDTNNFTFRTSAKTLEIASRLLDYGADALMVKKWLRNDLVSIKALNHMIDSAELFLGKFMIAKSEEVTKDKTFLSKISDHLLEIKETEGAFTIIALENNHVGVSARSYQNVNVQLIMEQMGGGGHLNSAAVQIADKSVEEVYIQLKEILQLEYDSKGEIVKVILIQDVKNKGKKDDIIEVAMGYAVYLKNNKLAIDATDENIKKLNDEKLSRQKEEKAHYALMNNIAASINGKSITLGITVGQDGKVFGAITTKQVAEKFEEDFMIALDKKKLELSSPINAPGKYQATISLHPKVKATFEINVVANRG